MVGISGDSHNSLLMRYTINYTQQEVKEVKTAMFRPKFKFTYDEIRIIVMALVELKNSLIEEGRYTDAVDDLLVKFVD